MMKKFISLLLALVMALSLMACGNNADANNDATNDDQPPAETVELTVFATVSLTESLTAIGEKYMAENENVKINFNFDSSGKLYTQIKEGASCDLFISAVPKQMNQLDGTLKDDAEKNPRRSGYAGGRQPHRPAGEQGGPGCGRGQRQGYRQLR